MPIQPSVTTQQNETQIGRSLGQPSDRLSEPSPAPASRAKLLVGAALLVLITAGAVTFLNRKNEADALAKETEAVSVPTVAIVQPASEPGNDELVLPGNLQAFEESPIFARTNGYLLRWYKDIGSKIQKGELLAAIDTPEVDQELSQARAAREQVKSALELAKISADRWANLRKSDSVSQQEADQQASGYQQAQANLAAADANVRRLEQLESFKNVYAPFSGVLTRRNVDPGALINSGAGGAGKELFDIARVDPLRVYVSVPQAYAPSMKVGVKATVTLQEFPGQKFTHPEYGSRCSQQRWQAASWFFWSSPFCDWDVRSADYDSRKCHAVPCRGPTGRSRRQGRQSAFTPDQHWARLRVYARNSWWARRKRSGDHQSVRFTRGRAASARHQAERGRCALVKRNLNPTTEARSHGENRVHDFVPYKETTTRQ